LSDYQDRFENEILKATLISRGLCEGGVRNRTPLKDSFSIISIDSNRLHLKKTHFIDLSLNKILLDKPMYVLETRLPFSVYLFPLCISEPSVVIIFGLQKNYFGRMGEFNKYKHFNIGFNTFTGQSGCYPYCRGSVWLDLIGLPDHSIPLS
jgi:hypothetical protein